MTAPPPAQAAVEGFDPGNIISDELFYDGNAMDGTEVQSFLDKQMPICLIGTPPYLPGNLSPNGTGNVIAQTCLRSFRMTTFSRPADTYCQAYAGAANETAAQIIAKVGRACGISPKVLLVMLEKEQSLVTDRWPVTRQYNFAMGMNCPDSGPNNSANCNSDSAGFFLQTYLGARQLKVYKGNPDSFRYQPFRSNTIQWHPNTACGASQVYIENWATAALYIYTPYRPNEAALRAGWGIGDSCSSYGNRNFYLFYSSWFGSTQGVSLSPLGAIEAVSSGRKSATIDGYAFDPETSRPIEVHYYLGGPYGVGAWGGSLTANSPNQTVGAKYPSYGPNHGFRIVLSNLSAPLQLCIYGINQGMGDNTLISCRQVEPLSGAPFGNYESAKLEQGFTKLRGWAIDPDDIGTVEIHAYLGKYPEGRWAGSSSTGESRADVQRVHDQYGSQNGFEFSVPVPVGTSDVCLYAIDREGLGNTSLGCRVVSTGGGPPKGNFEAATPKPGTVDIQGWALDPDTIDPVSVHVYVDGKWGGAYLADGDRPDVGRVFPGYGSAHGFVASLGGLSPGTREICVYGIDVRGTANTQIGCKRVQVPSNSPFGSFDGFDRNAEGSTVARGWALNPVVPGPVPVHAYLNGRWYGAFLADLERGDVGRAYPEAGAYHGYSIPVTGSGTLCVYAIDAGSGGANPLLGCKAV